MRKWVLLLAFVAVLWPGAAVAQGPSNNNEDSALIHINSDAHVAAGETADNLIVISADAVVDGTVTGSLVVIDGDATIRGTVRDNVTVISGDVHLLDGSTVKNVRSVRGNVDRASGATVTGRIREQDYTGVWAAIGVFSILFWIGMTIALLVAGIVFALIGGRQLIAAATLMTGEPVNAIIGSVVLAIGLPILAVISIVTVVGIPLGVGIFIFLIPALAFLGYLVAATRIGMFLTGALNRPEPGRPILAVVLGVIIMQVVVLIPVIGVIAVLLASLWGAGSLAFIAYRGAGGREVAPEPGPPPATA